MVKAKKVRNAFPSSSRSSQPDSSGSSQQSDSSQKTTSKEQSKTSKTITPSKRKNKRQTYYTQISKKTNTNRKKMACVSHGILSMLPRKIYQQMRYLQATTFNLIPKLSFARLVREIMQHYGNFRIQLNGLLGLQTAAEMYLVQFFQDSNKCTYHAKRQTIKVPDMTLLQELRETF